MRLAIINNTSYGTSGGHLKYLDGVLPLFDKSREVDALMVISPIFYNYSISEELSEKIIFKNFKPLNILFGQKCSSELEAILDNFCPDLIFIPNERLIKYRKTPTVVMVRNMEPFVKIYNNPIAEKLINKVKKYTVIRSCKKADHIIAVSNFVKQTMVNVCGFKSEKIYQIYHGGTTLVKDKNLKCPALDTIDNSNFLFTAGSIIPARGLEDIINAMSILRESNQNHPDLIIAGESIPRMKEYKNSLLQLAKNNKIDKKIKWTGKISKEEMGWCFRNSIATILTSRVESFSLIAQEAMSYGAFIISSDAKCLPETLNSSAIYYKSNNASDLAKILEGKCFNSINKQSFVEKAIKRSKNFSWNKSVEKLIKVFKIII